MSYLDTLQTVKINTDKGEVTAVGGSYDGETFYVSSSSYSDGKKIVTHEIVDGEFPILQDMGRLPRIMRIELYIIGDNCIPRRDKLIKKLTTIGEKELINPYFGAVQARAGAFTVDDSSTILNICRINVTFAIGSQADDAVFVADTFKAIEQQSASLLDNLIEAYGDAMEFIDSGKAYLTKVADTINTVNKGIVAARDTVRSVAEYQTLVARILQNTEAALLNGRALARDTIALVTFTNNQSIGIKNNWYSLMDREYSISAANPDPATTYDPDNKDVLNDGLRTSEIQVDSSLPDYLPDTVNKQTYVDSMGAFHSVVKVAAATNIAQAVTKVEFNTLDEIAKYTELVNNSFWDTLVLVQDTPAIYNNVQVLQATTLRNLDEQELVLPIIDKVELPVGGTVLDIVGSYYDNLSFVDTVVSLNSIKHPGFIPAGTTLEITR